MSTLELFIIALGLSMDAFAVAICLGLTGKPSVKRMLVVGLYFGVFQAAMPLIGYLAGYNLPAFIMDYNHWIAFALLSFLGGKMALSGIKNLRADSAEAPADIGDGVPPVKTMFPLALATSIDALAAGLSFALLEVNIAPAVIIIGLITFVLSAVGVLAGGIFGIKYRARAEIAGGAALVIMGVKILVEHYLI